MTIQKPYAPQGWPTVVPRIAVEDASGLVSFIQAVFNANGEYHSNRPTELRIDDSIVMIGDTVDRQPFVAFLYVYVPDVDSTYRRAVGLGAKAVEVPTQTPYGDRRCMVEDPWGNTWQIATRSSET